MGGTVCRTSVSVLDDVVVVVIKSGVDAED